MKIARFIVGLVLDIALRRLTRPRNVYTKLAVSSLLLSGTAIATPLWQQLVEVLLSQVHSPATSPLPSLAAACLFLGLTFVFAKMETKASQNEPLIDTQRVSEPVEVGCSSIYCFCGSVLSLSGVEVVVTSENTDLHLGSISGTSVSGRIRRLAASYNSDGTISGDHLLDQIQEWKRSQPHAGPYALGTCIDGAPYNAKHRGIGLIIHAITLEKRDSGSNIVEESANRAAVEYALTRCVSEGYSSIFVPVFGLGSGGVAREEAIAKTLGPLGAALRTVSKPLKVYVGTYRLTDAAHVSAQLLRLQNG